MKRQIIKMATNAGQNARNVLREELQWLILGGLHSAEAFRGIAFLGGTCLRLCHGLHRFSEDLDFSLTDAAHRDVVKWFRGIEQYVRGQGFSEVEVVYRKSKANVVMGSVRFSEVLFDAGLTTHVDQKLTIKVEIDCNPPTGAIAERRIVSSPALMALSLYDLSSMMAGKLHAVLARPYVKGRDWYDLIWYGSKGISPNLVLLDNALKQVPTNWCQDAFAWRQNVVERSATLKWNQLREDVLPFLENQAETELLSHDTIKNVFSG